MIPTLHEKVNLSRLLPEILNLCLDVDVLVVDDQSNDGTIELIQRLQTLFVNRLNLEVRTSDPSYAKSLVYGISWGFVRGYREIIQMDADGSHLAADIVRLRQTQGDLVIGSRYTKGSKTIGVPYLRRLYSIFGNFLISLFWKTTIRDKTNGFRLYRGKALDHLNGLQSESVGFSVQIELLRPFLKNDSIERITVCEIPIEFKFRQIGSSKFRIQKLFEALYIVWRFR